jgi:hypothetical protein
MNLQNKQERYFFVSCHNRSYAVLGNENTTLETVWHHRNAGSCRGRP